MRERDKTPGYFFLSTHKMAGENELFESLNF
jgi:hypothetical protein